MLRRVHSASLDEAASEGAGGTMLGAIADDFTGATDLATMLRRSGHRVVVVTPGGEEFQDSIESEHVDAAVVALKTRTAPVSEAVRKSLAALALLRECGADRFYVKYASTFDSTPRGTIGPVLDAVKAELGSLRTVVVPSMPANGRTVYQGHLFVGADLLENSSMRLHPLTPMTASRVRDLLIPQTVHSVGEIHLDEVVAGEAALRAALQRAHESYLVVDALTEEHLRTIGAATRGELLVSGGSGLALGIAGPGRVSDAWSAPDPGRRVVLCGSVSSRSLEQIANAARDQPVWMIDVPQASADPAAAASDAVQWVRTQQKGSIAIICAARSRDQVITEQSSFAPGDVVEAVIAETAKLLIGDGLTSALIVGGGESSGAVVEALGARTLLIGPEVSPGVCWSLAKVAGKDVALMLKSGNFGAPDMFTTAWEAL